ncbi:MAG: hypothetical protein ABI168_12490 [Ginsengibacter sp.]
MLHVKNQILVRAVVVVPRMLIIILRSAVMLAPYRLMQQVLSVASGQTWNAYCKAKLFDKIGAASALWFNEIMYCTTRDAARFGSLVLRKGEWDGNKLLTDQNYFNAMTITSQNLNLSYGYLWSLNGKASSMLPSRYLFSLARYFRILPQV